MWLDNAKIFSYADRTDGWTHMAFVYDAEDQSACVVRKGSVSDKQQGLDFLNLI